MEISEENGLICGLFTDFGPYNLADRHGMGGVRYTLHGDDIRTDKSFVAYNDKLAVYNETQITQNTAVCKNDELGIRTTYQVEPDRIIVESSSTDSRLSEYGIDLNLNFLSKKNGTYIGQLLPSSPYTSFDDEKMYCIMPVIGCGFCIVAAQTPCKAWRITYSDYCVGHFIQDFHMLSSLDDLYSSENNPKIKIEIAFAQTIPECYDKIQKMFDCPMVYSRITGTFGKHLDVQVLGDADYLDVIHGDSHQRAELNGTEASVELSEYGKYIVVPYKNGKAGLSATVWSGMNMHKLYEKSCDTIQEPYHCDRNLCEGMIWCWSMLSYMVHFNSRKYLKPVQDAMDVIMGKNGNYVPRNTIVPHAVGDVPAYHIYKSKRIQEQFYGICILTEMYKLTEDQQYLDFAVKSAETILKCYQKQSGALVPHTDYTTVGTPIIPLVDLAVLLKDKDPEKSRYFAQASKKIVDFLVNRGLHFPTEGGFSEINDEEMEDGSIACTALTVLYYCRFIESNPEHICFVEQVLKLHDYWRSYTPDVELYMSTMRWWETIWEGDGDGPAICAGHAWSIWRAEADFWMAVLTKNPEYFIKSWNGYMTNFSKITPEGNSYSCYQPDYFVGGGDVENRKGLMQLSEKDIAKRYRITHGYSDHYDNSLSRYVWARACPTWLTTAVAIFENGKVTALNCDVENKTVSISESIKDLYIFGSNEGYQLPCSEGLNILFSDES